jgi:hypothetical protein
MPVIGLGAQLEVNDGALDAFVVIDDIMNLQIPDGEFGSTPSKLLNQSADKTIRYLPTMVEPGEFSFQYEFSGTKKDRLDTLKGVDKEWKVTLPDDPTGTWTKTVPGFVKSNKQDPTEPDQIQTVTCVVCVSGPDV